MKRDSFQPFVDLVLIRSLATINQPMKTSDLSKIFIHSVINCDLS